MLGTRVPKLLRAGLWAILAGGGFAFGFTVADRLLRPNQPTPTIPIYRGKFFWLRLEVKPEDCWIGVFWRAQWRGIQGAEVLVLDVWLCPVPMVPLHWRSVGPWREGANHGL